MLLLTKMFIVSIVSLDISYPKLNTDINGGDYCVLKLNIIEHLRN